MNRHVLFTEIRGTSLFNGFMTQKQVDGVTAIVDCFESSKQSDPRWLAYDLATTYHETGKAMSPVDEVGRGRGKPYGLPSGPWHDVYYGRGDVQLTWESNYEKAEARLLTHGVTLHLHQHPELADTPAGAAAVLVYGCAEGWFTGVGLGKYFGTATDDPVNARRIVNGLDRAELVASYHRLLLPCVEAAMRAAISPAAVATQAKPVTLAERVSAFIHPRG